MNRNENQFSFVRAASIIILAGTLWIPNCSLAPSSADLRLEKFEYKANNGEPFQIRIETEIFRRISEMTFTFKIVGADESFQFIDKDGKKLGQEMSQKKSELSYDKPNDLIFYLRVVGPPNGKSHEVDIDIWSEDSEQRKSYTHRIMLELNCEEIKT